MKLYIRNSLKSIDGNSHKEESSSVSRSRSVNRDIFKLDTETSYYNNFLNESDLAYMQKSKNRTGEVIYMTPTEYYQECATKIFEQTTVENLKKQRRANANYISQYKKDMLAGDKFPLCYLNYADHSQEGLHRMMAAGEAFGWDTKFPVLVVRAVDDRVEALNQVWRYWNQAIYDAQDILYNESSWEDEFVQEVEWNLEHSTGEHYDVVIVDRRDREECAKYQMDYAIEIALAEFQDIMHPVTIFEPEFKDSEEGGEDIDFELDDLDLDDLDDDLFL